MLASVEGRFAFSSLFLVYMLNEDKISIVLSKLSDTYR